MIQKEHLKELETKMEIIASELDTFHCELMVISFNKHIAIAILVQCS